MTNIVHIRLHANKLLRKRRKRKAYIIKRNKERNRRGPIRISQPTQNTTIRKHLAKVKIPKCFSFTECNEELFKFINTTYKNYKDRPNSHLFFLMENIKSVDIVAICLLLSLINKLNRRKISCWGNYPYDLNAKNLILSSGFIDVMRTTNIRLRDVSVRNQMYMVGSNNLDSQKIGESVKNAMKHILGFARHYQPVYGALLEICSNSVEHANIRNNDKNWLISISYETDQVRFIVSDSGEGVLRTLNKKASELFIDIVGRKSDISVLADVFDKKYQSSTGELNRHKGLPFIKEVFVKGYISNLFIVTNKVIYRFESQPSVILRNEHFGTLFSWSVNKNNYELWQKQSI